MPFHENVDASLARHSDRKSGCPIADGNELRLGRQFREPKGFSLGSNLFIVANQHRKRHTGAKGMRHGSQCHFVIGQDNAYTFWAGCTGPFPQFRKGTMLVRW